MNYTQESQILQGEIDYVRQLPNRKYTDNTPYVLELRNLGLSLQKIGERIGVTRERVRQMEAKGIEIIRVGCRPNKYRRLNVLED